MSTALNAIVVQRIEVSPGLVIIRVVPDGWELPDFEPGQFAVLGLPGTAPRTPISDPEEPLKKPAKLIKRAYSIASSSAAKEYMEVYVAIVPSGQLTPRLVALRSGDRVWLSPKMHGIFTLDQVEPGRHVACLATGTGLAPYMSMLRSELVCGGPRRFVILQGARYSWDLGYRTELTGLARHCSNVTYIPVISRAKEDPSWQGPSGYLQDVLVSGVVEKETGLELDPRNFHIFLCGNPGMITVAQERLVEKGFVPDKGKESGDLLVEEEW